MIVRIDAKAGADRQLQPLAHGKPVRGAMTISLQIFAPERVRNEKQSGYVDNVITFSTPGATMSKPILLIQVRSDDGQRHFCHALEEAYTDGAMAAGCEVRRNGVASLDIALLHSQQEWEHGMLPVALAQLQGAIK